MDSKKKRILSYENMDAALKEAFDEKYPKGFSDYLPDLNKYEKPDGSVFYAVTLETEDTVAIIKIQVKTDAAEDIERWLDQDADDEDQEGSNEESGTIPDDNIAQYSNGEDDPANQD